MYTCTVFCTSYLMNYMLDKFIHVLHIVHLFKLTHLLHIVQVYTCSVYCTYVLHFHTSNVYCTNLYLHGAFTILIEEGSIRLVSIQRYGCDTRIFSSFWLLVVCPLSSPSAMPHFSITCFILVCKMLKNDNVI